MSEDENADAEAPKKKSKMPLILGLVLALAGGGGGFFAVQSGLILGTGEEHATQEAHVDAADPLPDLAFVPVDPLIITLGDRSNTRHLRFRVELEVNQPYQEEVASLMPRILDVLNGYLRAVRVEDLEDPTALIRLRAQMLRRLQTVTGDGRVRDLLIMEFVLN